MRKHWIVLFALLVLTGCARDRRGASSLSVQTTLPDGIEVTLVSVERPGTYVERATTTPGGLLNYTGIQPGKYRFVLQVVTPEPLPIRTSYTYRESEPFDVRPGRNRVSWTPDDETVKRTDE